MDEYAPVGVPWRIVFRLAMRYDRLRRLRELDVPSSILAKEQELVDQALQELLDYALVQGIFTREVE